MNSKLFLLLAAGAAATAACSHDKPAAEAAATMPTTDTAVVLSNRDTAAYYGHARALARRVGQDLGVTDTIIITRLVPVFVERERSLADLGARPDTAGLAAARRAANETATRGVQGLITDPAQQRSYAEHQNTYYNDGNNGANAGAATASATPADSSAPASTTDKPAAAKAAPTHAARRGPAIVKYENDGNGDVKIKYANGAKVKISADGDRKVVSASGRKHKVVGETGERKVKD